MNRRAVLARKPSGPLLEANLLGGHFGAGPGAEVVITSFDFGSAGRRRETGYHDSGERFCCPEHGATGPADDLTIVPAEPDHGSGVHYRDRYRNVPIQAHGRRRKKR